MDTEMIAFLDESRKPLRNPATQRVEGHGRYHYVVAAAVILNGDTSSTSLQLRQIRDRIGYPLHYQKLRRLRRRVEAVEAIEEIDEWDCYMFETARALPEANFTEHHVRAKTMEAAFSRLSSLGIMRAVLETRAHPKKSFKLDERDHEVLNRLKLHGDVPDDFQISHASKTQTLLQLPDLLAGARSDWICNVYLDPYARVSHRVRFIDSVFTEKRS